MTTMPSKRHPRALNLDGAWLLTETPEGTKEVPGMSIVADSRGITLTGPEVGTERTIPWQMTTGFQCQRPARLPDGSPATVLEVSLVNGRELQLLLPVTRVPPSETVVVETELAVLSDRYGGKKEGSKQKGRPPLTSDRGDSSEPAEPVVESAPEGEAAASTDVPGVQAASAAPEPPPAGIEVPAPAVSPAPESQPEAQPAPVAKARSVAPPAQETRPPAVGRTPPPGDLGIQRAPASAPASPAVPAAPTPPPTPPAVAPAVSAPAPAPPPRVAVQAEVVEEVEDRRQVQMLRMLLILIAVVVAVLIAELILIFFVLNHNNSTPTKSVPVVAVHWSPARTL